MHNAAFRRIIWANNQLPDGALGAIVAPFLFFVLPRLIESRLHNAPGSTEMGPRILVVFLASIAGFTALFFWMQNLRRSLLILSEPCLKAKNVSFLLMMKKKSSTSDLRCCPVWDMKSSRSQTAMKDWICLKRTRIGLIL